MRAKPIAQDSKLFCCEALTLPPPFRNRRALKITRVASHELLKRRSGSWTSFLAEGYGDTPHVKPYPTFQSEVETSAKIKINCIAQEIHIR